MKKTLLGAIPTMYETTGSGDIEMPGGGLNDSGLNAGGNVVRDMARPTDELPGGGPGMQVEPTERPEPLDEGTPTDDENKQNYLPWIIGGIVLFMLFRRK